MDSDLIVLQYGDPDGSMLAGTHARGLYMSVPNARPDGSDVSSREIISRAYGFLKQALALLDQSPASPSIGARLQEIIDSLDEQFPDNQSAQ
jgi:hypothetical protein